jgi:hypothetical protein
MRASRGMGAVSPSKMPNGVKKARRDDTDFTQYAKGGKVKKYEDGGDVEEKPKVEKELPKTRFNFSPTGVNLDKQQQRAGGRFSATKQLDDSSSLEGYLDANVLKRAGQNPQGKIAGLGVKYTKMFEEGGKAGLYDNINAKRKRIAAGSGEKMRKPGSKGAPTAKAFVKSAKTARK